MKRPASKHPAVAGSKLSARMKKFDIKDRWDGAPVDETRIRVDPSKLPKPIDFSNINGKPLSSKKHINDQNTADSAALVAFAAQGNLKALKDYHYDAVDKETGSPIGKKPIADHPAQLIQKQWGELMEHLQSIAYPPADVLSFPSFGIGGGNAHEVADAIGYYHANDRVSTISSEYRMGFFMKLQSIDSVDELLAESKWHWLKSGTGFAAKAKQHYQGYSSEVQSFIGHVQGSGSINKIWSLNKQPTEFGIQTSRSKLTAKIYAEATELPEGMQLWRWMSDTAGTTVESLLKAKPGDSFQNTNSMCASFHEGWGNSSKFGSKIRMRIRCAKGAKALLSYGSGGYQSEGEFTTLPGARFVILSVKKGNPANKDGVDVDVLMLPPDEGYVAEVNHAAGIIKSITIGTSWNKPRIARNSHHRSLPRLAKVLWLALT